VVALNDVIIAVGQGGIMPPKVRELKAKLSKAGFTPRKAKGSHTVWKHPALPGVTLTISGQDGKDARPYLVDEVRDALKRLERM
jgi:predicted RNA binding protein YcfA (HicA-like mRNA interferase family)